MAPAAFETLARIFKAPATLNRSYGNRIDVVVVGVSVTTTHEFLTIAKDMFSPQATLKI
jgi:hypothetical protein